jgi:hypothetical protein
MEPQGPVEEGSSSGPETASEAASEQTAPPDAGSLVNRMIAVGEWPEPALVEQILAAGEAAVEPLREVLKTRPMGWPAEAPIVHAAGVLSMLRPPSVLPDLINVARFYKGETTDVLANAIAQYGLEGFDALLELIGDPSIAGNHRNFFIDAVKRTAGDDPVLRARLAAVLRQVFTRVAGEVKEFQALEQELLDSDDEEDGDDEDDLPDEFDEDDNEDDDLELVDDEDLPEISGDAVEEPLVEEAMDPGGSENLAAIHRMEADNEIPPSDALSLLASDLADLADPLARDMIESAFAEDLFEEWMIDPDSVKETYDKGGRTYGLTSPWLQQYSASYLEETRRRERLARMPQVQFPSRTSYPSFAPVKEEAPPAPVRAVEPFRYAAPKIGRNDPCWCGSGKKYKRCHLGKDAPTP